MRKCKIKTKIAYTFLIDVLKCKYIHETPKAMVSFNIALFDRLFAVLAYFVYLIILSDQVFFVSMTS